MRPRPKGKYEDENGVVNVGLLMSEPYSEYPEAEAWDKEFGSECDRLSALSAAKHKRHWGRWYLNTKKLVSLDTDVWRPGISGKKNWRSSSYWIELSRVNKNYSESGDGEYTWIKHMSQKNWIGEQGLADLKRAFDELIATGEIK